MLVWKFTRTKWRECWWINWIEWKFDKKNDHHHHTTCKSSWRSSYSKKIKSFYIGKRRCWQGRSYVDAKFNSCPMVRSPTSSNQIKSKPGWLSSNNSSSSFCRQKPNLTLEIYIFFSFQFFSVVTSKPKFSINYSTSK